MTWTTATGPLAALALGVAAEQASVGGGLEKLFDSAPLVAALLGGLWLLFKAYQGLVEKVISALDANTRAFSENAQATRKLGEGIEGIHKRVDSLDHRMSRMEHDEDLGNRRQP